MKRTIYFLFLFLALAASTNARQKVRVACIGNSITYGMKLADPATESYPAQLQTLLGSGYEVGNFGKSGATLLRHGHRPYVAQEEWRRAKAFRGDIAVVHLGVNDTDPRNWPYFRDEFVADYIALIDTLRQVNPQCRIIIARLTPITFRHPRFESGTRDWENEIQTAIETVAQAASVELVDFHHPLYAYPQLMPDAVHPNKEGAAILAKTVWQAITGDYGGLRMPETYSDNMVLQRDRPLVIRGRANAGEHVWVEVAKAQRPGANDGRRRVRQARRVVAKAETTAAADGTWSVELAPQPAATGLTLSVGTATRSLIYNNVAYGEVWLCSGQSNMEFMLKEAATASRDIQLADCPDMRLFDMKARWRTNPVVWEAGALDSINHLDYFAPASWQSCTPATARNFSAIAYYFGRMLQDSLRVPIGLICNAVGGSPTEAWVDRATVEKELPRILPDWTHNDFVQPWVRERGALNIKNVADADLQRHPYQPCYLYESAIEPLEAYAIKGVIWYQGESNAQYGELHNRLFSMLVDSWRKTWGDNGLPFYFVQLSSLDRKPWGWFRDNQRRLLGEVKGVEMAVSSDVGDSLNVHPTRKQPVGERLARIALNRCYGYEGLEYSGPLVQTARLVDGDVRVAFAHADGLATSDGMRPSTFEIAEHDGLFVPAEARVDGGEVVLHSDKVRHARLVRYGWQPFTRANLVNAAGLPASTFRIEVDSE